MKWTIHSVGRPMITTSPVLHRLHRSTSLIVRAWGGDHVIIGTGNSVTGSGQESMRNSTAVVPVEPNTRGKKEEEVVEEASAWNKFGDSSPSSARDPAGGEAKLIKI